MSQSPHQQSSIMDSDTMLDVYILDYLTKRKLNASKKAFGEEAKVSVNHRVAIDAPRGFLLEWWTVFWDIFISRYKHHQGIMEPINEDFRVPQQHQQHQQGSQHQSRMVNANNVGTGKNAWVAEASTQMRQAVPKQCYGDNAGLIMNHINSMSDQPIPYQKQSLAPTLDISNMISSLINQSAQGSEGLPREAHAAAGTLNNMPLKGWPLTGLDQIRGRVYQQQGALHPPPLSYEGQMQGQSQLSNEREISQTEDQLHHSMENKRKQPLMSSSDANTSATANVIAASLPRSPQNDKINIDDFLNYGALDGNDNLQLSRADKEADVDPSNGFSFSEIGSVHATSVNCCDISCDGKLVAVGGHDKKARLWCTSSLETKATLDGHSQAITDIRFSPSMLRLATSSHDKTVKIWDLENPGSLIKTITGHTASVTSVDFHPKKEDLICSCDETEIRYWSVKKTGCIKMCKRGASLVRFQSGVGKYLASVVGKSVSLSDLENNLTPGHVLKGHGLNIQSLCWDSLGEHLISVSEDSIKVWRMDVGGKANCIHTLSVPGKRFRCGIFHPSYPSLLVIGCYQSMELWNMTENKMMMPVEEPVFALVVSGSGLVASAGHNGNVLKLWK
ncbi:putative transcription factor WD40-like family [Helianthus annuus]|nr:putative transcription factor WD40-like family [Helianthus annuus]